MCDVPPGFKGVGRFNGGFVLFSFVQRAGDCRLMGLFAGHGFYNVFDICVCMVE